MKTVGTVESLWRYPVKSMRGEELPEMFAGFSGVYGDRLFAFRSSVSPETFPYLTARDQSQMLLYRPKFRHPGKAAAPINLQEADPADLMLDVETPAGARMAIDDPALIDMLREGIDQKHQLDLLRSERALTDCRPVSLLSLQSVAMLSEETGAFVDKRRFRANSDINLTSGEAFAEDQFVGRSLRIGSGVIISILQRDGRCVMITLDPDTAEKTPALLKKVAQSHSGMTGVYGAVLTEGIIRKGDPVELLD